jgi:hypothetical protein
MASSELPWASADVRRDMGRKSLTQSLTDTPPGRCGAPPDRPRQAWQPRPHERAELNLRDPRPQQRTVRNRHTGCRNPPRLEPCSGLASPRLGLPDAGRPLPPRSQNRTGRRGLRQHVFQVTALRCVPGRAVCACRNLCRMGSRGHVLQVNCSRVRTMNRYSRAPCYQGPVTFTSATSTEIYTKR